MHGQCSGGGGGGAAGKPKVYKDVPNADVITKLKTTVPHNLIISCRLIISGTIPISPIAVSSQELFRLYHREGMAWDNGKEANNRS